VTDLARYVASNPLDVLPLPCIEFSHPDWPAPHRRVLQPDDWTVSIDGVPTLFPGWHQVGPWLGAYPPSDDSGRANRKLSLDDVDQLLEDLITGVAESAAPVRVRIWLFVSDDLATPLIREVYLVQAIEPDGGQLDIECVSRDYSAINDPYIRHTPANSPGLRGR